jgi:hypothetical protein
MAEPVAELHRDEYQAVVLPWGPDRQGRGLLDDVGVVL